MEIFKIWGMLLLMIAGTALVVMLIWAFIEIIRINKKWR